MRSRDRQTGFTLLELLVAAAILTLIAVFAWRGLDALLREREVIASSQDVIDATSRAFARLERDALLARDAELTDAGELRLAANPAAETASAAVTYRVAEGSLVRTVSDGSEPIVLMKDIAAGTFDVWVPGQGATWSRTKAAVVEPAAPAPPVGGGANANVAAVSPGAANPSNLANRNVTASGLRLVLARADGTTLVRIFMIGSGG